MASRREVGKILLGGCLAANLSKGQCAPVTSVDFDVLFRKAAASPSLLDATRQEREGLKDFYALATRAGTPVKRMKSTRAISQRAIELIILFEVSNKQRYESHYRRPVWPGGKSGVTIGIGYDLGYQTATWLNEDWGQLDETIRTRLITACAKRADAASALLPQFRDIDISWETAEAQFRTESLPRYVAATLGALPNAEELSNDSLGALVSLVYNRGQSFANIVGREEMAAIHKHMHNRAFKLIPREILGMKQLWVNKPKMKGLLLRRDLEAALFEAGLR